MESSVNNHLIFGLRVEDEGNHHVIDSECPV